MKIVSSSRIVVSSLIIVALVTTFAPQQTTLAADTITMAFQQEPFEHPIWRWAELIYTEAFHRIGLEFHYKVYPSARASMMADSGRVDGEPARIIGYDKIFPNLVRVEEVIVEQKIVAHVIDPDITLDGWESLRGTGYRVDYLRGSQIQEQNLPKVVNAERLSAISQAVQGFKKLIVGRIEVFVSDNMTVQPLLASPEFKDSGIREAGILQDISTYPYLHKRHAALAPKLAEVLKQMKEEGLIQQYLQQAKQEFAQD